jgi:gliding-associated putative ABC transporter substrate-binding component GldG
MLTKRKIQITILLVFAILVLVNLLSTKLFFRLDFTEDKRYSLSDATENILENLNEPVTVTAYFSEDLPPDISKVRQDFRDLLVEYSNKSASMVVYEFVNPNENQEDEMKAQQNGIQPLMINVRERDQLKQQRAYLGAIVQLGEKKEVIPYIQPGAAMEYALSTSIKKLSVDVKPKIAFLQGNGEPGLNELIQLREQLSVLYDVDTTTLNNKQVPADVKTLVIINPKDTIAENVFNNLDEFLSRGGNIVAAYNSVEGDLQNGSGNAVETNFGDWLKTKGIEVEKNFLIDVNCSNVMVRQQQGGFSFSTPVSFPYIPIITSFSDHPVTEGLENVVMPFVSPIKLTQTDTSITVTPLAVTSSKSGVLNPPLFFDVSKDWSETDFGLASLPVAVAVEGNLVGNVKSKLIVFSDGDFIVNGSGQRPQQLQPDNVNLMSNSIDWLSDDTGLVELRTKGVSARPIDPTLEDGTKLFIKYLNFLLPIILIIAYGIFRYQKNLRKKNKLMSESYV